MKNYGDSSAVVAFDAFHRVSCYGRVRIDVFPESNQVLVTL